MVFTFQWETSTCKWQINEDSSGTKFALKFVYAWGIESRRTRFQKDIYTVMTVTFVLSTLNIPSFIHFLHPDDIFFQLVRHQHQVFRIMKNILNSLVILFTDFQDMDIRWRACWSGRQVAGTEYKKITSKNVLLFLTKMQPLVDPGQVMLLQYSCLLDWNKHYVWQWYLEYTVRHMS